MKSQLTYGIFDDEADHLIDLVKQQAPLQEIVSNGCPACGAPITIAFGAEGAGFTIWCQGTFPHGSRYEETPAPPDWWRECYEEPQDTVFHWPEHHSFDAAGRLSTKASGYDKDGTHWTGHMECSRDAPDYPFWKWLATQSKYKTELIGDDRLDWIRAEYQARQSGKRL